MSDRKRGNLIVSALAVIGIVGVGVLMYQDGRFDGLLGRDGTSTEAPAPVNAFLGTRMANWPEGAAGFVAPPPAQVGKYGPDKVSAFTDKVRAMLVAARLNPEVLTGKTVQPVLDLFAPESHKDIKGTQAELGWARTLISPKFRLATDPPRVTGSMTVSVGDRGALVAKTNFIVAYAFHHDDPRRLADPTDRIATERWEAEYLLYEDATDGKLWPGATNGFTFMMDCAAAKEGLLAPTFGKGRLTPTTGPSAKHDESYYLDPTNPITDESCT
ncbi:hypothetical protein GCM10022247_45660 [Allokutzneria multivorans]|uniref:Uncharacterized protein n=1 Tax=Allokutzneria multivorans TaxID=1142134 RepID=A0ABP7SW98_9PSEU